MRKYFFIFFSIFFLCSKNFFANAGSSHCIFVSGARHSNISFITSDQLKLKTKDKEARYGFDLAYCFALSEKIYLGAGIGYFSSNSSLRTKNEHSNDHFKASLDGDYLKFPLSVRLYGDEFANILRVYLYGDLHYFLNLKINYAHEDEDPECDVNGKKFSLGTSIGGGINISLTSFTNFFVECLFALRPMHIIEIKNEDEDLKIYMNGVIINLGIHLDLPRNGSDDLDKID